VQAFDNRKEKLRAPQLMAIGHDRAGGIGWLRLEQELSVQGDRSNKFVYNELETVLLLNCITSKRDQTFCYIDFRQREMTWELDLALISTPIIHECIVSFDRFECPDLGGDKPDRN
jgi:hypothetical protein